MLPSPLGGVREVVRSQISRIGEKLVEAAVNLGRVGIQRELETTGVIKCLGMHLLTKHR